MLCTSVIGNAAAIFRVERATGSLRGRRHRDASAIRVARPVVLKGKGSRRVAGS
jgi:hypothetical protein